MGAGNWLPGGYLLKSEGFYVDYESIYGEGYYDDDEFDDFGEMDWFKENIVDKFTSKFNGIYDDDGWLGNDGKIILSDGFIHVVTGDNQSSVAVYVVLKEPDYDEDFEEIPEYEKRFTKYVEYLKEVLLEYYPEGVSERAGAWTSGRVK